MIMLAPMGHRLSAEARSVCAPSFVIIIAGVNTLMASLLSALRASSLSMPCLQQASVFWCVSSSTAQVVWWVCKGERVLSQGYSTYKFGGQGSCSTHHPNFRDAQRGVQNQLVQAARQHCCPCQMSAVWWGYRRSPWSSRQAGVWPSVAGKELLGA